MVCDRVRLPQSLEEPSPAEPVVAPVAHKALAAIPGCCTILGDLKIEAPFFEMTADKVSIYRGVFRQPNLPSRSLLARLSLTDGNRIANFDARRNHPWRPASVSIESAQPFLDAILTFRLVFSLLACCLSAGHAKCSHRGRDAEKLASDSSELPRPHDAFLDVNVSVRTRQCEHAADGDPEGKSQQQLVSANCLTSRFRARGPLTNSGRLRYRSTDPAVFDLRCQTLPHRE